jgi:transcriptional regulator with XRE-family HTH domain
MSIFYFYLTTKRYIYHDLLNYPMAIRYQLKSYRLSKNYTQQYIADQLFISRQQYCNIENGRTEKISGENKKKLAELLDIPDETIVNMDILVYTKQETGTHNDHTIKYNDYNAQLIEGLIEQNKQLMLLLENFTVKDIK